MSIDLVLLDSPSRLSFPHSTPSFTFIPPSSTFASTASPTKVLSRIFLSPLQIRHPIAAPFLKVAAAAAHDVAVVDAEIVDGGGFATLQVNSKLAIRSVGAEAGHVELAEPSPDVTLPAPRALLAEASVVVLARGQPRLLLDVDVEALVAVLAVAVLVVELALAHLPQVVLVEVVARVPLLAQAFEPVLAHVVVVLAAVVVRRLLRRCRVAVGAPAPSRAVARRGVVRTDGDLGGEGGDPVGSKERSEAEVVRRGGGRCGCCCCCRSSRGTRRGLCHGFDCGGRWGAFGRY